VHLVGHSRGGYAVTRMALDHPDLVRTLTVVSSSSVTNPFNPVYSQWREKAETMEERAAVRYLISANSYSDEHITETMVDAGVEIGRLAKTRQAKALMDSGLYEEFKAHLLRRIEDMKRELAAGQLQTPTLVLWGFNDPSATVERCLQPAIDLFLRNVRDSELHVFNQAGHYCYREQPEAFADTLIGFIGRHGKGEPQVG
jgi:2-hydroxy-6-oxonona-2,4-dienedioate hydrolase